MGDKGAVVVDLSGLRGDPVGMRGRRGETNGKSTVRKSSER